MQGNLSAAHSWEDPHLARPQRRKRGKMPALPGKTYAKHPIRTATVRERMGLESNRCTLPALRNCANKTK
jgi:hypothetical protein